jgi:hypothetical protein
VATEDQDNDKKAMLPPLDQRGATRRRLAKAGIGTAGVLLTLESRSAMGAMMCKSPSGALSGGLSSNYGPQPVCQGLSPGYWKNHDTWPISRDTLFANVFYVPGDRSTCTVNAAVNAAVKDKDKDKDKDKGKDPGGSYLCSTMLDLLSPQSFDQNNLAMHAIATYLNILSGRISFLSVETVLAMWRDVQTSGHYSPTADVYWSREQVKNYLEATHD